VLSVLFLYSQPSEETYGNKFSSIFARAVLSFQLPFLMLCIPKGTACRASTNSIAFQIRERKLGGEAAMKVPQLCLVTRNSDVPEKMNEESNYSIIQINLINLTTMP
jgi:hypothetical protein